MDDTVKFTIGIIVGLAMIFIGVFGVGGVASGSLSASVSHSLNAGPVEGIVMSFNTFKDNHNIPLSSDEKGVRVLSHFSSSDNPHLLYVGTDAGLFFSRDGGLGWNRFTTSDNEIDARSSVYAFLELSDGSFVVSSFSNGEGVVYQSNDRFFTLEELVSFDDEAVYSFYQSDSYLYMGLSSGQVIEFDLNEDKMRVLRSFSSPVVAIEKTPYNEVSLLTKSGTFYISSSADLKEGREIRAGKGSFLGLFSSSRIDALQWTDGGILYVLSGGEIHVSYNNGRTFSVLGGIPTGSNIDTFSVLGKDLYVLSGGDVYVSDDYAVYWKKIASFTPSLSRMHFFPSGQIMMW